MSDRYPYLKAFFFPQRCAYCGTVIEPRQKVCAVCAGALPRMQPPCCPRCGRTKALCICRGHKRQFDRCCAPFHYEAMAKAAVVRLKDGSKRYVAEVLAGEMADAVRENYDGVLFDAVTFVPPDRRRSRRRDLHASEQLARELAKRLQLPCRPLLCKIMDTPAQKELKPVERSGNVLGAFDLAPGAVVQGQTLLLVDDVITTGSTLNECAKMLKIYGATCVLAVAACATVPKNRQK